MSEKIIDVSSLEQYKEDMQRYAIYISRERSIPDIRDGLKPVHRKILYCMYANNRAISHTVKSASVVGKVIELYHPHGDTAVYDSIKPMVNWFQSNIPLIDKQGNFGNFQGDSAAASRYTEVKLSKFALDCLISELQENNQVVDWNTTYDNSNLEPDFLPASVPLLLINGSFGICIGIKVDIPGHNINEVIDATITLIDNPDAQIELIPEHSMPCEIINTNFKAISNKGSGTYKVRGVIDIEEYKGRQALIIKSVPDLTFLNSITETIEDLVAKNKIIQIQDVMDESSDKEGIPCEKQMRYVIILKKGADPYYVRDVIYKHTSMQKTCRVNFEVLDGINPVRMSYKSYLLSFINFRKLTKFRLYCNKLQIVNTRIHEREMYIKVLQSGEIDNIIKMIRGQKTVDDNYLVNYLIDKLKITDLQAKFILGTDLRKLSVGYLDKYIQEAKELQVLAKNYMDKITYENLIESEIKEELLNYKHKYGKKRICKLIEDVSSDIPQGEFKIVITENNYIKKLLPTDIIGSFRGDNPKHILVAENTENILLCDEMGKVFKLPVNKISLTERNSLGTDVRLLIKGLTSNICTILYEPNIKDLASKLNKSYAVILTANGAIKRLDLEDFMSIPLSGILYTKLEKGDCVNKILIVDDKSDIVIYSNNKALRINILDIPHLKRNAKGAKSMNTDHPIAGVSILDNRVTDIVVVTEEGRFNRFLPEALERSGRGKSGNKVIKLGKGDAIKAIFGTHRKNTILVITKNDKVKINVSDIPEGSSISSGTKLVSTKGDNIIKCKIIRDK